MQLRSGRRKPSHVPRTRRQQRRATTSTSSASTNAYHVNHPHMHPGLYKDRDEVHRHRLPTEEPKSILVRTYRRRKQLF